MELLVVLAILGTLATLSLPVMQRGVSAPSGSRAARLRARAVLTGRALTDADSAPWRRPVFATPDGIVFADSAAGMQPLGDPKRAELDR